MKKLKPKTREEILSEYALCMQEAVRLREALGMIILCVDYSSGKMREKLEAVADMAEAALYAEGRWDGVEAFSDMMKSEEYKAMLEAEKNRSGGLQ